MGPLALIGSHSISSNPARPAGQRMDARELKPPRSETSDCATDLAG